MAKPTFTETVGTLFSTTWPEHKDRSIDNITKKTPLIFWLKKNQRMSLRGGRDIRIPIQHQENSTGSMFGRGAQFDIVETDPTTAAIYQWTNAQIMLLRYWTDELDNSGEHQIISYVRELITRAENDLTQLLEEQSFGDGSGTNDLDGLQKLIDITPATGTVGGINAANEVAWRNQFLASTGAASVHLLNNMRTLKNDIAVYNGIVDYIITTQTVAELFDQQVLEQKRIVNKKMGDAEFMSTTWMGIPVVWSPECPSGYMYMIDSRHMDFIVHPAANFDMMPWRQILDQHEVVAYITARLQLVTDKRRALGVITGNAA